MTSSTSDGSPVTENVFGWMEHGSEGTRIVVSDTQPTAQEIRSLRELAEKIAVGSGPVTFQVLSDAWRNLDSLTDLIAKNFVGRDPQLRLTPRDMSSRAQSSLMSFLAAARMYVDSMRATQRDQFGREAPEYTEFVGDTNHVYDSVPGYRFTERLRNIVLHTGNIPGVLHVSSTPDSTQSCLIADRDDCLDSRFEWNSTVRQDIRSGPQTIDIKALLSAAFDGYEQIERRRRLRNFTSLKEGLQELLTILSRCEVPEGAQPAILSIEWISETPRREWRFTPSYLPPTEATEGLLSGIEKGDLDSVSEQLPPSEKADLPTPAQMESRRRAVAVMETWLKVSPADASTQLVQVVNSGPEESYETLMGFMEIASLTMLQLDMVTGIAMGSQLRSLRKQPE